MPNRISFALIVAAVTGLSGSTMAQDNPVSDATVPKTGATAPAVEASGAQASAPAPLVVYFDRGSSLIREADLAVLDKASRAYNEGKPIVMVLTGSADRTGHPETNLTLSQRRATAVLKGLLDRGIPAERFQVLAKGATDLPVPTDQGVDEQQNRRVEITWR